MRRPLIALFLLLAAATAHAAFFPYKVEKRTLPNGLDVVVIETPEFKDVVSFNTLILAGSRNEIEKGRSGLAHLFEHIAFRHKSENPAESYDVGMTKLGAFDNAWTWFDVTYYHPLTFSSNLEELARLQGERFVAMEFPERVYRTEAGAVLGEYRRNASDPSLRMEEVMSDLAFGKKHGYGHTTMGYLADVEDMPSSFKSGKAFYDAYYRPNNAVVIVIGDVKASSVFDVVQRHYGAWKPKKVPDLPEPAPIHGPKHGHVAWESDVPPRIDFAYRAPPFDPGSVEGSAIIVLPELISGDTALLYRLLRYEKKVATDMATSRRMAEGFDARMIETFITVDKGKYDERGAALLKELEDDLVAGVEELKNFSARPNASQQLESLKSKLRYDLLGELNSPSRIAETFAWYYRFERDPNVFDTLVAGLEKLKPADIDAFARKFFTPDNRVIVTMSAKSDEK